MKKLLILLAGLFMILLLILGFLSSLYSTNYSWDRDYWNQIKIAKAYVDYFKKKNEFPNSLENLVESGLLPYEADFYQEPPGWYLVKKPITNYQSSTYIVLSPKQGRVDCLCMIARRIASAGKEDHVFNSSINADIRDEINFLQRNNLLYRKR